jgi:hypothetical protein
MDSVSLPVPRPPLPPSRHASHLLSRRTFLGGTAGVGAAAIGAALLGPTAAFAARPSTLAPNPTTTTFPLGPLTFSIGGFDDGVDPSSITDFKGFVGVADVQGTGIGTNRHGASEPLLFDTDMRFMTGVYVAQDGRVHEGTFGFV